MAGQEREDRRGGENGERKMSNEQTTKYVPMDTDKRQWARFLAGRGVGFPFGDEGREYHGTMIEVLDSLDAAEAEIDRLVAENNRLKADNAQLDRELDATMAKNREHVRELVLEKRELKDRIRLLEEGF